MLNTIRMSVIMLNVVAPSKGYQLFCQLAISSTYISMTRKEQTYN